MKMKTKWTWSMFFMAVVLLLPAAFSTVVLERLAWALGFTARVGVCCGRELVKAFWNGFTAMDD